MAAHALPMQAKTYYLQHFNPKKIKTTQLKKDWVEFISDPSQDRKHWVTTTNGFFMTTKPLICAIAISTVAVPAHAFFAKKIEAASPESRGYMTGLLSWSARTLTPDQALPAQVELAFVAQVPVPHSASSSQQTTPPSATDTSEQSSNQVALANDPLIVQAPFAPAAAQVAAKIDLPVRVQPTPLVETSDPAPTIRASLPAPTVETAPIAASFYY